MFNVYVRYVYDMNIQLKANFLPSCKITFTGYNISNISQAMVNRERNYFTVFSIILFLLEKVLILLVSLE